MTEPENSRLALRMFDCPKARRPDALFAHGDAMAFTVTMEQFLERIEGSDVEISQVVPDGRSIFRVSAGFGS